MSGPDPVLRRSSVLADVEGPPGVKRGVFECASQTPRPGSTRPHCFGARHHYPPSFAAKYRQETRLNDRDRNRDYRKRGDWNSSENKEDRVKPKVPLDSPSQ